MSTLASFFPPHTLRVVGNSSVTVRWGDGGVITLAWGDRQTQRRVEERSLPYQSAVMHSLTWNRAPASKMCSGVDGVSASYSRLQQVSHHQISRAIQQHSAAPALPCQRCVVGSHILVIHRVISKLWIEDHSDLEEVLQVSEAISELLVLGLIS